MLTTSHEAKISCLRSAPISIDTDHARRSVRSDLCSPQISGLRKKSTMTRSQSADNEPRGKDIVPTFGADIN